MLYYFTCNEEIYWDLTQISLKMWRSFKTGLSQVKKKKLFLDSFVTWEGITDGYNDPESCVLVRKNRRDFTISYTTENR